MFFTSNITWLICGMALGGFLGVFIYSMLLRRQLIDFSTEKLDSQTAARLIMQIENAASGLASDLDSHNQSINQVSRAVAITGKKNPEALSRAIEKLLKANHHFQYKLNEVEDRLQSQVQHLNSKIEEANLDPLTGLYNRRRLDELLDECRLRMKQDPQFQCTFTLIDIDFFKKINDTYGHLAGDDALKNIARYLKVHYPDSAMVARYGGEEFAVVQPGIEIRDAAAMADEARSGIARRPFTCREKPISIHISVGLSQWVPNENNAEFIERADQCLYASKKKGRNQTHWHDTQEPVPYCYCSEQEKKSTEEPSGAEEPPAEKPSSPAGHDDASSKRSPMRFSGTQASASLPSGAQLLNSELANAKRLELPGEDPPEELQDEPPSPARAPEKAKRPVSSTPDEQLTDPDQFAAKVDLVEQACNTLADGDDQAVAAMENEKLKSSDSKLPETSNERSAESGKTKMDRYEWSSVDSALAGEGKRTPEEESEEQKERRRRNLGFEARGKIETEHLPSEKEGKKTAEVNVIPGSAKQKHPSFDTANLLSTKEFFRFKTTENLEKMQEGKVPPLVVFLRIDQLVDIINENGVEMGRAIFKTIPKMIINALKGKGVATYYDKGVFAVLFEQPKLDQTLRMIEQIRIAALKHPVTAGNKAAEFSLSLGVARGTHGENAKQMFQRADDASLAAVKEGGNQIFISNGKEVQPLNLTVLK